MRKFMTKEVTKTTVKVAQITKGENGLPVATNLDDVVLVGNVALEKAQKEVAKRFDHPVTVFGVEPSTQLYRLSVEEFLSIATLVTAEEAAASEGVEAVASEAVVG